MQWPPLRAGGTELQLPVVSQGSSTPFTWTVRGLTKLPQLPPAIGSLISRQEGSVPRLPDEYALVRSTITGFVHRPAQGASDALGPPVPPPPFTPPVAAPPVAAPPVAAP